MTPKLSVILSSLILSGASATLFAADQPSKPGTDQGTTMQQPDKPATGQEAQKDQPAQPGSDSSAQTNQPAKPSNDVAAQLKSLDADKDGTVSKAEAEKMKGLSATFDQADQNKDGKLDANELSAAMSQIKK